MKDQNRFGCYMAALRKDAGLELSEAGLHLGVSTKDVHDWEAGYILPSVGLANKICSLYRIGLGDFREILEIETSLLLSR
jgi:DNA-binding XRE family transcriptional regulator